MLEIKPIATICPVIKAGKIKKDEHLPNQQESKKKPKSEEQEPPQTIQHIDENA